MKFKSLFAILLLTLLFSCNAQPSKAIESVTPEVFAEKINTTSDAQIVDVRTPEEFTPEHLDNAININWFADDFTQKSENLDKSKAVFVYCKSGARSAKAAAKLEELGFKKIYQLEGGILKWYSAGLSKTDDKISGMTTPEYAQLLNTEKAVLINFYAEWCEPCKKMEPYLLQMQKELANKVTIIRLNADENKTLVKEMKIDELPTLLLYKNKELTWKHTAFISEADLKNQLK